MEVQPDLEVCFENPVFGKTLDLDCYFPDEDDNLEASSSTHVDPNTSHRYDLGPRGATPNIIGDMDSEKPQGTTPNLNGNMDSENGSESSENAHDYCLIQSCGLSDMFSILNDENVLKKMKQLAISFPDPIQILNQQDVKDKRLEHELVRV